MRPTGCLALSAVFALAVLEADVDCTERPPVGMEIRSVRGEPGETLGAEVRATMDDPLSSLVIQIDIDASAVEILGTDVSGAAAAHISPREILFVFTPGNAAGEKGYILGVQLVGGQLQAGNTISTPIPGGTDVLVFKIALRIRADAVAGEYPIALQVANASVQRGPGINTLDGDIVLGGVGAVVVLPPGRPRPVKDIDCRLSGHEVELTWTALETYDAILVERNDEVLAELPGRAASFRDAPLPGIARYGVVALRGETRAYPAACEILVPEPRPAPVTELACASVEAEVRLTWRNGDAYDRIVVSRNGREVGSIEGGSPSGAAGTFLDAYSATFLTVYTVCGEKDGVRTLAVSCRLNEMGDTFAMRAEDVRAPPASVGVPVKVLGTCPLPPSGYQIVLQVSPEEARLRDLDFRGTLAEAYDCDFVGYHSYWEGMFVCGVVVDLTTAGRLPAGADQHLVTAIVDLLPGVSDVAIAVSLEKLPRDPDHEAPTDECMFDVVGRTYRCETISGAILVGTSPVPEVEGARADLQEAREAGEAGEGGGGEVGPRATGILISWRNGAPYDSVRIARDGKPLAELPGEAATFLDLDPGAGLHDYGIVAVLGGAEAFPVTVSYVPSGIPGTFIRGDANLDGRLSVTDAVALVDFLFREGPQPECLDAGDADDDGALAVRDVLRILFRLFRGDPVLPPPGPENAWFDPTEDDLPCE